MLVKRAARQPPSREPASSDRLPVHRSESPTGYSSAGCSPAEPASASPVSDIVAQPRSGETIKCAAQPHCKDAARPPRPRLALMPCRARRVRRQRECHLYFARRVSSLSCADIACRRPIKCHHLWPNVGRVRVIAARPLPPCRPAGRRIVSTQAACAIRGRASRCRIAGRAQPGRARA